MYWLGLSRKHGNEATGDSETKSTAHRASSCVRGRCQKSRQWKSLVRTINGGIRTANVCGMIPGFGCPFWLMGSLLDRVESNGSRSVAVDIVLDGRDGGIKSWSSPGSEGSPFRSEFSWHEFNDIDHVRMWCDGDPADRHQTRSTSTEVHESIGPNGFVFLQMVSFLQTFQFSFSVRPFRAALWLFTFRWIVS